MNISRILKVKELQTSFFTQAGEVNAVNGISFQVGYGEVVGIVGESGCGKTATSLSIMNLLPLSGRIVGGSILLNGIELTNLPEREMRKMRGNEISMIFQDSMSSLNPVYTLGNQIIEPIRKHKKLRRNEAKKKALKMLYLVGFENPENVFFKYPHELSGGMRQRAMIAMALSCAPQLLIADEPTTALDVTIQAQIINVMIDLKEKTRTSIILITHNLGIVAQVCDRIIIMYAGLIMEQGTKRSIFYNSKHPYTWGLLKSIPHINPKNRRSLIPIKGQPPDLRKPITGCPFHPRCEHAMHICKKKKPPFTEINKTHIVSCWLLDQRSATSMRDT